MTSIKISLLLLNKRSLFIYTKKYHMKISKNLKILLLIMDIIIIFILLLIILYILCVNNKKVYK